MRALGLLKEISKTYEVTLVILTRQPLTTEQTEFLGSLASQVISVRLRDVSFRDKIRAALLMKRYYYPYHSAILEISLQDHPEVRQMIYQFPGVVFTGLGHWGHLIRFEPAPNWILNQCDADVEFWRVYASQTSSHLTRYAALINWKLSRAHFPQIYRNAGQIISVCEEDRLLTLELAPHATVHVIENGVDCSYYTPEKTLRYGSPRLLFTGTSAARNMTALHRFVRNILPLIREEIPDIELLVAGNFSQKAQTEFIDIDVVKFTGRVDDIRPYFNQADVYVAPFEETHGSKLKIAEAMAMAMPIVSTRQGIRGFSLVDGESVLIADSPEQFAANVLLLLRNPELRMDIGTKARQVALKTIDWPILGQRLRAIVESVCIKTCKHRRREDD